MSIASSLSGKISVKHPTLDVLCREDGAIFKRKRDGKSFAYTYGTRSSSGYLHIQYKGKYYQVHRLIAEAFLPNIDNKPEVDHINRIKTDNQVSNLRWVTREENLRNRDDADHCIKIHGVRWCEDRRAYLKSHNRRTLHILSPKGRKSNTCFLPDDIYNELKPLSTRERTSRYAAWKQSLPE